MLRVAFTAAFVIFASLPSAARAASIADAHPGDLVRVDAASLKLGGELVSQDDEFLRLRLESGEVAIPKSLITSLTVVRAAVPLPAMPAAPSLPAAPHVPRAPRIAAPGGIWLTRWSSQLSVAAIGGGGGTHETPIKAHGNAASAGGALGFEFALPGVSLGADASFEEMRETLVASGRSGCPSNLTTGCFAFPEGLDHLAQVARGGIYAKPYLMFGAWRPWLRVGGEFSAIQYAYTGGSAKFGSGDATGAGVTYGAGLDLATKTRGMVFSLGVTAGGAHGREKIDSLFGAPWESRDAGPVTTAARVSLGVAIPIGRRE